MIWSGSTRSLNHLDSEWKSSAKPVARAGSAGQLSCSMGSHVVEAEILVATESKARKFFLVKCIFRMGRVCFFSFS